MMKFLILIFPLFFLLACKVKEPIPNRPPGDFKVNVTLEKDGKTVTLNWDKAVDPDGDSVTYIVVLEDTLVKNFKLNFFQISSLGYEVKKNGKVIAIDSKGLTKEQVFIVLTSEDPYFIITDSEFETYLVKNKLDLDGLVNQKMKKSEAKAVDSLIMENSDIKNLNGIEEFVNLEKLIIKGQLRGKKGLLSTLNLNKNLKLKYLNCSENLLSVLDVTSNINLEVLICSANRIENLNLNRNVKLKTIECDFNGLSSLNLTNNVNLIRVNCRLNRLGNVDFSKNIQLKYLRCDYTELTKLQLNENSNLVELDCSRNSLKELDLSKNHNLTFLKIGENKIEDINVSKNIDLVEFWCNNNLLNKLDLRNNSKLEVLWCINNRILSICVNDLNMTILKFRNYQWRKDETAEFKICN